MGDSRAELVSCPWYLAETESFLRLLSAADNEDTGESVDPYAALVADRAAPVDLSLAGYPHPATDPVAVEVELPGRSLNAKIYRPPSRKPSPVLLWLHGGGFIGGSLRDVEWTASRIAVQGHVIVLSLDYRLAPEDPYPAGLMDVVETVAWVHDNAEAIGAAPVVAVGGQSAGAALAAGACLLIRDTDTATPQVAAQVLAYPCLDIGQQTESARLWDGVFHSVAPGSWADSVYLPEEPSPYALPLRAASLKRLPPALVLAAGMDPLRDDARRFHARLESEGVESRLAEYEDTMHAFLNFPMAFTAAEDAVRRIGAFLRATVASEGENTGTWQADPNS